MNKLGFQINRFYGGPGIVMTVNGGDWTKKVVDIRNILTLFSEDASKFAMFMSFSESGAYLCVARMISGRGGDNTAGWIFIPNTVEISGNELIDVINVVKEELSAPQINAERVNSLFDKNYPAIEAADFRPSSAEKVYAKRNAGFYPLCDIIGINRYQPEYSKYNAILIHDKDSMEIIDKNVVDLTMAEMINTFVFCPPVKADIPAGVTVHFAAPGEPPFNKPVRVKKSTPIDIIFKRRGYEDIHFKESVEENNQICGVPKVFDWKMIISRAAFKIVSAQNRDKDLSAESKISVNGVDVTMNKPLRISEQEAANAEVSVTRKGYVPKRVRKNLLNVNGPVTIELTRAEESQTWTIELANGHHAEMTLTSKYLSKSSVSPLKGYSIGERAGQLDYTNFGVLKERIIGFAMGLGVCAFIYLLVALWGYFDSHNFEWQLGWPPLKVTEIVDQGNSPTSPANSSKPAEKDDKTKANNKKSDPAKALTPKEQAIKYLEENETWTKDELDSHTELVGLFDDLNEFNIASLKSRERGLKDSSRFMEIIEVIKDYPREKIPGSYMPKNDTKITVSNYIQALTKKVNEAKAPEKKKETAGAGKQQPAQQSSTDKSSQDKDKGPRGGI
ncbi:MAG: hypothetical protein K2K82_06425 [Muribaculaceae bacterium]|nr:hypothetical protein [Muribaculaceae bacterium]